MATRGLFVIKFYNEDGEYSYYAGYNNFSKQLRQAKIYVIKERAIEVAEDLITRKYCYTQKPVFIGTYNIVEVELHEKVEYCTMSSKEPEEEFQQLTIFDI